MFAHLLRKLPVILLSCAVCLSLYLTWQTYFYDQPIIGCSKGSGCSNVLTSHWSKVLNIPILALGIFAYISLLVVLLTKIQRRWMTSFISYIIIFAGIWFFCIQVIILHAFCVWCCTIHSLAILSAAMIIFQNRPNQQSFKLAVPAMALLSIIVFASTQYFFPSKVKTHKTNIMTSLMISVEGGNIKLFNGKLTVAQEDLPRFTDSSGKAICLILSDHTCPHCLEFQQEITAKKQELEKDLTIYFLPSFQSMESREINRLLMIARRVDSQVYESTLIAIQTGSIPLSHVEVSKFLNAAFKNQFDIYLKSFSPWSYKIMDLSVEAMRLNQEQAQVSAFPQAITANHVVEGVISMEDLIELSKEPASAKLPLSEMPQQPLANSSLEITKRSFHLGRITKNGVGKETVTLKNTGEKPIKITKINVSCECIKLSKELFTLAPHSEKEIPFEFATKKFLGTVTHQIFLYQEGIRKPESIPITVDVWLPFKILPYSANFGNIAEGSSSKVQTINLINGTQQPVDLTLLEQQDPLLNDIQLKTIIQGTHYQLSFNIKSMPSHSVATHLNLKTSHPDCPELNLPVNAINLPAAPAK